MRGPLLRLTLVLGTLALVLVALEVGLRFFWDGFYLKLPKAYAQAHPLRGWSNRPDVSVPYGEPEFAITVTHDRFGYRSAPIGHARVPGRVRVLVLGDSFAYGVGVEDHETFSAQLQALAPRLEVINTGVNGYGTHQQLLLLRDEGLAFRPDVVLVAFFWNDVANGYRARLARFSLEQGRLRYPEAVPGVAAAPPARERRAWLRHSYAYRFVSDRWKGVAYWARLVAGVPLEESDLVDDTEREAAWELERALLREIDRLARAHGARTLLLLIPDQVQVEPGLRVKGLEPDDYEVQGRLGSFADASGIPLIDPLPELKAARAERGAPLYYLRDRHLVPEGHAVLARAILARLEALGWTKPGPE